MWDVLVRTPRGSNNPRKFSLLLTMFFMACFAYIFASAPPVYAANATWEGDEIVYDGNTYAPVQPRDAFPQDIKASPAIYQFTDAAQTPNLVYFIYFSNSTTTPKSEKEATYIRYTLNPPNRYINPTTKQTILLTPVEARETSETTDTEDGTFLNTCTIDSIGWLVCPLMNGIAEGMDFIFNRIRAFLEVQPITTSVNNPIYRIWSYSRDLANIAFVLGFMVIIYSYLVGGGFNGYEIRKILPRLVMAAILINISYVICAAAVDISNIAGYGVNQLFENVRDEVLPGSQVGSTNWTSVTAWVLAGGVGVGAGAAILPGAIGGAVGGLWFMLAPFLLGAALLVMVTFLILAARQAIIIILIAIAPLAFAAFILPNTEKWFERWRSLFFTMLVMFPAFGAVFGGAQLAGEVIIRTATNIEQIILGLGVMVAPLAITPLLLKLGGGILNRFGGIVNNPRKGVYDRYKNYNRDRLSEHVAKNNATNAALLASGGFKRKQFMRRRAANDFAKKNFRDEQKKQDEESAVNSWHRQTGRWGYDNHQGRGEGGRNWYNGAKADGYGSLDMYKRRNSLQHDNTEKHHEEHWQSYLQGTAGVGDRQMLTDTRLSEGRGKVLSGAMEAQDERTFQTALNTDGSYANLRNMKVQTSVDTGVADVHKAAIESAGKLALSTTVDADRGLRKMKVQTFEDEKRSETIDNTLKKNAEAHWNNLSKNDSGVQELRLREVRASDQANITDQRYNTMLEDIVAEGAKAPGVSVAASHLANSIQELRQDIQIEAKAQEAAKVKQGVNLMTALKASQEAIIDPTTDGDPTLLKRAAGIGGKQAEARIFAQATKSVVDAAVQEVKDDRYLLSQYTRSQLHDVLFKGKGLHKEKVTTEMRQAAMYELLQKKGNNDDAQVIRDAISDMGMVVDETTGKFYEPQRDGDGRVVIANGRAVADTTREITDSEAVGKRRDWQQFFTDAASGSPHSMITLSGTDKSDAEAGTLVSTVKGGFMRDALGGKFGPEKMLKADIDELKYLYTDITDPQGEYGGLGDAEKARVNKTITEAILALQTHPTYKGQIDDRNRGVMNQIVALADPTYSAGLDTNGKPLFYVDEDKALIKPPVSPTGDERTFSAPVPGDLPEDRRNRQNPNRSDWEIR